MTELQYLKEQSRHAKASAGAAIMELKKDAAKAVDPRRLVRKHPWMSLGAVLVLGFATTAFIGRTHHDKSEASPPEPVEDKSDREHARSIRKWFARAKLIAAVLKPLLEGFLAVQAASTEIHDH